MNKFTKTVYCLLFSLTFLTAQGQNSTGMVLLEMESGTAQPGETICLNIAGSGMSDVLGMQFSIRWDPNLLEFAEVSNLQLQGMSSNDFGTNFLDQGALTFAYIVPLGSSIPDVSDLFSICLRAKEGATGSSAVTLSNSPTALEFVVDIDNIAQTIKNYTLLGGQVLLSENSTTETPLSLKVKNDLMTNCLIEGRTNINVEATGGTPPYTYEWTGSFGYSNTGADLLLERSGDFQLLVTDAAGRTLIARFAIQESDLRISNINATDNPCSGAGQGSINLSVEGGQGARIYRWSNGAAEEDLTGLEAGTYSVTVSDQVGCAAVETVNINAGTGIRIDPEATPPNCGEPNGSIKLNAQSEAGGIFYNWKGDLDGDQVTGLAPGKYEVTVLDNEGCRVTADFDFSWEPLHSSLTVDCYADENNQIAYSARADVQGGTGPYNFNWSTGASSNQAMDSEVNLSGAGSYAVTITDAEGCTDQQSIDVTTCGSENPVWPGDTDNNGEVSHFDLLNIGLGFGQEGPARETASLVWQSQASLAWEGATAQSNVNFKYADTNGDGKIDAADTTAIIQHWGQRTDDFNSDGPVLSPSNAAPLFVAEETVAPDAQISLDIILGSNVRSVEAAYGIAFSIIYDPVAVNRESIRIALEESWLGAGDLLMIQRHEPADNRIDLAITRTDLANRAGAGAIAQLRFKTTNQIPNQLDRYEMNFRIENPRLINANEQKIDVSPMETTVVIDQSTSINDPAVLQKVTLFPNPARHQVELQVEDLRVRQIELLHPSGKQLRSWQRAGTLEMNGLSSGSYILRILTEEGVVTRPLILLQ